MMRVCAILLTVGVVDSVVRVPLLHWPNTLQEFRKVRAKRASRRVSGDGSKEAGNSVPVRDTGDWLYYGEILVGTPPQPFYVLFETGTANLWVPDEGCWDCWWGAGNYYENSSSSTFYQRTDLPWFMSPIVNGSYAKETVIIGGLPIENQTFAQVWSQVWSAMIDSPYDGICGLGGIGLAKDGVTPPLYNLVAQGKIKHAMFGIHLDSFAGNGSVLTIGGTEKSLYVEDLFYVPFSPLRGYYPANLIEATDIKVDHKSANVCGSTTCQMIMDTGSGILAYPPRGNTVMQMLGNPGTLEELNCSNVDSMPLLTYTIHGKDFDIGPEFYVSRIPDADTGIMVCTLVMEAVDPPLNSPEEQQFYTDMHMCEVGDPFHRKYYITYDYDRERMGFALAKQTQRTHAMLEEIINARLQTDTQMLFM